MEMKKDIDKELADVVSDVKEKKQALLTVVAELLGSGVLSVDALPIDLKDKLYTLTEDLAYDERDFDLIKEEMTRMIDQNIDEVGEEFYKFLGEVGEREREDATRKEIADYYQERPRRLMITVRIGKKQK